MHLKKYIFPVALLLLFYLSTKLYIYNLLKRYFSVLDSYLLDQLLFLFIFIIVLILQFFKKRLVIRVRDILISILFFVLTFVLLQGTLKRYFIGDDLFVMLKNLKDFFSLDYAYIGRLDYFYYHFMPFSLVFRFFRYEYIYYNVVSLMGFSLSAILIFKLLRYLASLLKLKYRLLPFLLVIFSLATPSLLSHFHYLEHSVAIGYIVAAMISSIYFYFKFLEGKEKQPIFFILSYLLTLFLLKFALTRSGFFPAILITIEFFYKPNNKNEWFAKIVRVFLILVAFFIMAKPFFIAPANAEHVVLYRISPTRFIDFDRIYQAIAGFFPFIVPFPYLSAFLKFIRQLIGYNEYSSSWIAKNIFFTLGLTTYISYSFWLTVQYLKKRRVEFAIIFWLAAIFSILFFTLAGYGPKVTSLNFDYTILSFESQFTGAAYVFQPMIFVLISFYFAFISCLKGSKNSKTYFISCFLLIMIIFSSINHSKKVNLDANSGPTIYRTLIENILKLAPDNNQKKVIYSVSGPVHVVKFMGVGEIGWFYDNVSPVYLEDKAELIKYLNENEISAGNLYAFSFDELLLQFQDKSADVRIEMKKYLNP